MFPIASTTLATASPITFSSIPQNFTHLQARIFGRTTSSNVADVTYFQFNGDSGSNYVYHYLLGDGSSASSSSGTSQTGGRLYSISGANATSNVWGNQIVDILDYTNTNKNKTVRSIGGFDNNGSGQVALSSSLWLNTAAVTSITFYGLFLAYAIGTRVDLYGIQSSPTTGA
jgi:hypothetical protein